MVGLAGRIGVDVVCFLSIIYFYIYIYIYIYIYVCVCIGVRSPKIGNQVLGNRRYRQMVGLAGRIGVDVVCFLYFYLFLYFCLHIFVYIFV